MRRNFEEEKAVLEFLTQQHMSYIDKVFGQINAMARLLVIINTGAVAIAGTAFSALSRLEGVSLDQVTQRLFVVGSFTGALGVIVSVIAAWSSWKMYNAIAFRKRRMVGHLFSNKPRRLIPLSPLAQHLV